MHLLTIISRHDNIPSDVGTKTLIYDQMDILRRTRTPKQKRKGELSCSVENVCGVAYVLYVRYACVSACLSIYVINYVSVCVCVSLPVCVCVCHIVL